MSEITLNTSPKNTTPSTIYEVGGDLVQYDSSFWNGLNTSFPSTTSASMTGYESFSVKYTAFKSGTTTFTKYRFDDGQGNIRSKSSTSTYTPTYSSITFAGKPGEENRVASSISPSVTAYTSSDIPYVTGINGFGTVEILERWPTTQIYASAIGDNGEDIFSQNRIVYGYEPTTAVFTDFSVARTFPISGWYIDYDDGTTEVVSITDASYHPRNSIVEHAAIFTHVYARANTYNTTVYTEASTTGTKSANVYSNYNDYVEADKTLNTAVTCRIDVYPTFQLNNFFLISGVTVQSNYTATTPTGVVPASTDGTFISGYCPNLTVMFKDSSIPTSFPISSYQWDFGDVFDLDNSIVTVTASTVQTGFGLGWKTDKTNHSISYTYRYPGLYNVTLGSEVSTDLVYNPEYSYSLAAPLCTRSLLVYVEEILPQITFGVSPLSTGPFLGSISFTQTPMTVYFNASASVAGSFPIGKMTWDFGDGTIESVLSSTSVPFPQNYIVSHEYDRTVVTEPSTFNVGVTGYAFNTESYDSSSTVVGELLVSAVSTVPIDIPAHLLETSLFGNNDVLMVLEGSNKTTLNYLISTRSNIFIGE